MLYIGAPETESEAFRAALLAVDLCLSHPARLAQRDAGLGRVVVLLLQDLQDRVVDSERLGAVLHLRLTHTSWTLDVTDL